MYSLPEDLLEAMVTWRRELHMHPETAFNETRTAGFIARNLGELDGMEVHPAVTGTGVVGVLRSGDSPRAIALRAEMDGLPIRELNAFPHRSRVDGCMHACGHDGHIAMLLGAARRLSETRRFNGTVVFLFQPGEENAGGARRMVEDGFFNRFPVDAVFGLHNIPGLPAGTFATREGPLMAAIDTFEIEITGTGTHAAMPHMGVDPLIVGAEILLALQTVVSRELNPLDHAVVSATQIRGGDTWNVIPETALLRGCTRFFREDVGDRIARSMNRIVTGICTAHGAEGTLSRYRGYPPTVNAASATHAALRSAVDVVGPERVNGSVEPVMASEDFAYLAAERPGCLMFIGNGAGEGHPMVHSPHYDFNDDILPPGAAYWVRLVERELPVPS